MNPLYQLKLVEVCPEYKAACDLFEREPTEENWAKVREAATAFRTKVKPINRDAAP